MLLPSGRVPLSVLDLVPRARGMSAADALRESGLLAEEVERLGYHRLWMAEHHGSETFMASATSVLLAHLAGRTRHLRLGAGGVMLPNHSPLVVAEHYGTLAALYGDRIDLGLGRGPGADKPTTAVLQRGSTGDTFAQDVVDLIGYLGRAEGAREVRALPGEGTAVPVWMLGSSPRGARLAASLGLPFAYAGHVAPGALAESVAVYREEFSADSPTAGVDRPTVMLSVNALAAPTQEEAEYLFSSARLLAARFGTGPNAPLDPPVADVTRFLSEDLLARVNLMHSVRAVGTPAQVVDALSRLVAEHAVDELILVTHVFDPELRRRSFRLLAEAWGLAPRG